MSSTLNIVTRLGLQENPQKSDAPMQDVTDDMPVNQPQQRLSTELEQAFNDALQNTFADSHSPLD